MDLYPSAWKWIFFLFAALQFFQIIFLLKMEVNCDHFSNQEQKKQLSFDTLVLGPWKNSLELLRERADFRAYQIAFLFGGSGLILVQPILPIFFEEVLQLSYMQLAFAISICKGIGFILTSPIWANWINRISIHLFNFYVISFAACFALILVFMGQQQIEWIYLAFFIYGVMQAGSELSWHLSGPLFAKEEDSTLYTSVNVAMVGLRGCIIPFLGEIIFLNSNINTVFICSAAFCLVGACYSLVACLKKENTELLDFSNL